MNLLERMKVSIDTMTMGEKFLASIQVTLLGIGIVFVALAILYFSIVIMEKLINKPQYAKETIDSKPDAIETVVLNHEKSVQIEEKETIYNTELVAVITAAIASSFNIPAQDIVIRNIKRVQDPTPTWAKAGRMEQINNML